jgi:hypothetical protein
LKNEKQKWMAQIRVDGKLKNFGPFEKKEDAEALERELQWWGDIPVEATPELLEKIKWLEKCMSIASEFVDIRKCQSCKNPYAAGYICSCGRDNSYSMIEYTVKVYPSGTKFWYLNGKRHREDGPAIETANGGKEWCLNDKRHREDGPAVEYANGGKLWYLNGELHREDGPAIEYVDGRES